MVANFDEADALEAPVVSAISLDADVVRVNCRGMASSPMTISKLFASIAEHGANVDIISHNRSHDDLLEVGFTVSSKDSKPALEAIRSLSADPLFRGVEVSVLDNLSKVSAVGLGMKSHSGVAAKVFETLSAASIELLMVATSEIKISCVVSRDHGQAAVKALHLSFFGK
jgi:aspartate kinase